mgnify:CR=1 FL=1
MREIICFHNPGEPNGYLSNWYPSVFRLGGVEYASTEQYIMYQKAILFQDVETARQILATEKPGAIKALGRGVQNYNDAVWSGQRQIIVYQGLLEKFRQNKALKKQLLTTGESVLAECAVRDKIWGIGLSMKDPRRFDLNAWQGQNLLGFSLMCVRAALREEQEASSAYGTD